MSNIVSFQEQKQELEYFKTLAAIMQKTGQYKDLSTETMLNIMLTAKDLGISPAKAINGGFYVVNGKIGMSTALMADRIRKAGNSIKIVEWTEEKCVIIAQRKDNGDSVKLEFNMKDAERAGLTRSSMYQKWPKPMLYNRCMSLIARVLFSDVVGNAYSEDEKYDIMNVPPEKRPVEDPDFIEVKSSQPEEKQFLSKEQVEEIDLLIGENKTLLERILSWQEATCISEISADQYDRVIKGIQNFLSKEGAA
jgi:hypothetical protein